MQKPDLKSQDDFKSIGFFFEEKNSFKPKNKALGVLIEIGFPLDTQIESLDFDVVTVNPRGVRTVFTEFQLSEVNQQKLLSFKAFQEAPEKISFKTEDPMLATSFIDLCWYTGVEAVDPNLIPTVVTKVKDSTYRCDLGWFLPSRFVDSAINALGKLNEVFLSGTLEDAIVYGPIILETESNE